MLEAGDSAKTKSSYFLFVEQITNLAMCVIFKLQ